MSKHTSGPWRVSRGAQADPFSIEGPIQTVAHIKTIATRSIDKRSYVVAHEETEANARLIAAAPEMHAKLTALIDLRGHIEAGHVFNAWFAEVHILLARIDGGEQ